MYHFRVSGTIIDQIVRDHLAPALKAEGFTRKGRTFRKPAGNGDAVLIEVQLSDGSRRDEARFYLNISVLSQPWLAWLNTADGPVDTDEAEAGDGSVRDRIRSPENPEWYQDTFTAGRDDVATVGASAVDAVRSSLPDYLSLLDRSRLLTLLRDEAPIPGSCNRLAVRAVLAADAGEAETARRDAAEVDRYADDTEFIDWIERRLR